MAVSQKYDVPAAVIGNVVRTLLETGAAKVTAYLSEKLTVKASRVMFAGRISKRDRAADVRVTLGEPNYAERKFIALCKKAGEPLPVKRLQIKMP